MAFCPECGKSVAADDATCATCGKKLQSEGKKGRAVRFNGTMMMAAPLGAKAVAPANLNAEAQALQRQQAASAAGATSPRLHLSAPAKRTSRPPGLAPAARSAPPQTKAKATVLGAGVAPQPRPSVKPKVKNATMVGAALAPTTPRSKPPAARSADATSASDPAAAGAERGGPRTRAQPAISVRAMHDVPVSTQPKEAAGAAATDPAPAPALSQGGSRATPATRSPRPQPPTPTSQAPRSPRPQPPAAEPHARASARPQQGAADAESASKQGTQPRAYLPGDPMAPQQAATPRLPRGPRPAHHAQSQAGSSVTLYWAVCVAVVAAAAALAFRLF